MKRLLVKGVQRRTQIILNALYAIIGHSLIFSSLKPGAEGISPFGLDELDDNHGGLLGENG